MGSVNCKPARHSSSSAIKAQKPIEKKKKKSFRSLLRVLISRKRSNNKISPDCSSVLDCEASPCPIDSETSLSPVSVSRDTVSPDSPPCPLDSEASSRLDSKASLSPDLAKPTLPESILEAFCTGEIFILPIVEGKSSSGDENIPSQEDTPVAFSGKLDRLRKDGYREHALNNRKKVGLLKDKFNSLQDLQRRHQIELRLLSALRISAVTTPRDRPREAKVNASIKKLTKTYNRCERKLYKVKRKRDLTDAKVDLFLTKLSPNLKYTDIYANNNSFYLSPILEESQAELEIEADQ